MFGVKKPGAGSGASLAGSGPVEATVFFSMFALWNVQNTLTNKNMIKSLAGRSVGSSAELLAFHMTGPPLLKGSGFGELSEWPCQSADAEDKGEDDTSEV